MKNVILLREVICSKVKLSRFDWSLKLKFDFKILTVALPHETPPQILSP